MSDVGCCVSQNLQKKCQILAILKNSSYLCTRNVCEVTRKENKNGQYIFRISESEDKGGCALYSEQGGRYWLFSPDEDYVLCRQAESS
jgi:hypothetical protein